MHIHVRVMTANPKSLQLRYSVDRSNFKVRESADNSASISKAEKMAPIWMDMTDMTDK